MGVIYYFRVGLCAAWKSFQDWGEYLHSQVAGIPSPSVIFRSLAPLAKITRLLQRWGGEGGNVCLSIPP